MTEKAKPRARPSRDRSVFINCPFDAEYKPLMRAACFTIIACGYFPRCALEFSDSGSVRLHEIVKLLADCDFSIHDLSRVELDQNTDLPRFNMPLELGADLGLKLKGPKPQRSRKILVLDSEPHRYDMVVSDISGMDIETHEDDLKRVILRVRDWLNAHQRPDKILPGAVAIAKDYETFASIAPSIVKEMRLDSVDALHHIDYLRVVDLALPRIEAANSKPDIETQ